MPLKFILFIILFFVSLFGFSQNETSKDSISNKLNEVVISQNKKSFSNQNGNIKLDVANSIYNSIPNTLDLLAKLPAVQISSDREKITIIGKGNPLIYIDNQKVGMNDLNALAVADIKSIEIVKNPSAKYEAEGRAVILIMRKFSKKDSFQTSITEVAFFKKDCNNYLGFNSNFKKNKIEWKANFNYNKLQPWESHRIDYQIPDANIVSNYDVSAFTKRKQFIFGGGFFYKINEVDYVSFNVNSKLQNDFFDINTATYNKNANIKNNVLTFSDNDSKKNFVNSFLNYIRKIKSIDTQVFAGLQYSIFDQNESSLVQNNYNDTEFQLTQDRNQKFNVDVFSGRIDLEKKFKNDMKLEIGGLYSTATSKSDLDFLNYETNKTTTNHYDFKEQNSAWYSQFSGEIKKVNFSVGLRVENTKVNGKFISDEEPLVNKNYTNLFPKVQLTLPIDTLKTISLNYARSISRPNYASLSQGSTYINPYFLYARNINLDPTINNEISSTFQLNDKTIKLCYYQNNNPVYSSFSYNTQQNIMTFKEINFDKESGFNLELTAPFKYRNWSSTNSLSCTWNKIEDDSALFRASKPYLYYYSNNEFKLPKGYTILLTGWGLTEQKEGVFERNAKFIMDFAISKTFFTNWNCTLSYNDIFRNMIYEENFTINNISSKAYYLVDSHEFSITIKYSFGKIKSTEFKEKSIDDNSNRIR